jgi:Type IV secretory pathway, VirJ component
MNERIRYVMTFLQPHADRIPKLPHYKVLPWIFGASVLMICVFAASAYALVWYHRFYHHITPQELSHEVKHSSYQVYLHGGLPVTLHQYQQENALHQKLVLFTSGDGGWSPFCADIAAHIAASGMTVVGVDAKDYLVHVASSQKPISAEELTLDYDAIAKLSVAKPGVDSSANLILAGWSLGAGYSVLVASQPEFSNRVDRVVAISPPIYNELAWKPTDALIYFTHGTPREKVFDARQYVKKLGGTPMFILNATDDDTSPLKDAQLIFEAAPDSKRLFTVKARGHHFEGGETEFYRDLDQGLSFRNDENFGQSGSLAKK